jgi:hypothetical protein
MRRIAVALLIVVLGAAVLTGCKKAREEVQQYSDAVMTMPDKARVISDLTRIRLAIEMYKADNEGKYPNSVSDLKLKDLYYTDKDEYQYDSSTGKITSKNYPTF